MDSGGPGTPPYTAPPFIWYLLRDPSSGLVAAASYQPAAMCALPFDQHLDPAIPPRGQFVLPFPAHLSGSRLFRFHGEPNTRSTPARPGHRPRCSESSRHRNTASKDLDPITRSSMLPSYSLERTASGRPSGNHGIVKESLLRVAVVIFDAGRGILPPHLVLREPHLVPNSAVPRPPRHSQTRQGVVVSRVYLPSAPLHEGTCHILFRWRDRLSVTASAFRMLKLRSHTFLLPHNGTPIQVNADAGPWESEGILVPSHECNLLYFRKIAL